MRNEGKVDCSYFSRQKQMPFPCLENKLPCMIQACEKLVQWW